MSEDFDWAELLGRHGIEHGDVNRPPSDFGSPDYMTGYDYGEDEYDAALSEDEGERDYDYDYGDINEGEFNQFEAHDPDEYGLEVGYGQLEHISYADPELGTTMGGKMSKTERMVMMQTVSKEKLYVNRLKADLYDWFSFEKADNYIKLLESVPRYWLKNPRAIAATFYMIDRLRGTKLNTDKLADFSGKTNIRREDLFRYYRLLNKYIKFSF
jgi:hypothetical protein